MTILPPISVIVLLMVLKPRPVPLPSGFVVKKGGEQIQAG
jgi:hypothetical protein